MDLCSVLASGLGNFCLGKAWGLVSNLGERLLNRRFHGAKWGGLFKCLQGKEGEAT